MNSKSTRIECKTTTTNEMEKNAFYMHTICVCVCVTHIDSLQLFTAGQIRSLNTELL